MAKSVEFINKAEHERKLNRIIIAVLLVFIIGFPTLFFAGYHVGRAAPGSSTPVFEHPAGPYSYLIWEDNGVYYAKNGDTGEVTSGTNKQTFIQGLADSLTSGGTILLKEVTKPTLAIPSDVMVIEYYQGEVNYYPGEGTTDNVYVISVDSTNHTDYGLAYPVTYIFNIPSTADNMKVYYKFETLEDWQLLTEYTSDDFFNGVYAVRFDYTNDKAYVSIGFKHYSDHIFLKFLEDDSPATVSFSDIPEYYDNRVMAVTVTVDDIRGGSAVTTNITAFTEMFTNKGIWLTWTMLTEYVSVADSLEWKGYLNELLSRGFIEVGSHGKEHAHIPYSDYDWEIGGSKHDIVSNLNLPWYQWCGERGYVWAWSEPYGESDDTARQKLGEYKYLCDRDTTSDDDWATWDSTNGLYHRIGYSIRMGTDGGVTDVSTLNSKFDSVKSAGGIYHLQFHINTVDWSDGSYADQHTTYISQDPATNQTRKDVWFVGFGALYMYHYVDEQNVVNVTSYQSWRP